MNAFCNRLIANFLSRFTSLLEPLTIRSNKTRLNENNTQEIYFMHFYVENNSSANDFNEIEKSIFIASLNDKPESQLCLIFV